MNKAKIKLIAIIAIVILIIVLILANNKRIINQKAAKLTKLDYIPVSVFTVKTGDIKEDISFIATAYPNKEVNIATEVAGKVIKVNFTEGTFVKAGDVLVQIDDQLKQSAYENAKALFDKAEKDLQRNKELYNSKSISDAQMEAAELNYYNAKNQLKIAQKLLKDTKIIAPFSGYITQKMVEIGAYLNVGNPIATIVDVSSLKIKANIAEKDAFKLKKGDQLKMTTDVYPTKIYYGNISYISPKGDDAHTYPIEVMVNNSNGELKAGMIFNISYNYEVKQNKLVIPRDAIIGSIKNPYVYVVNNDVAELRYIKAGEELGKFVQVIDGLKSGEKVVVKGKLNITNGSKLKSTEEN
ncbi:MAG TPA: efflux RND transporter periplasmic adaptor subunit [Ignavibacteriales bacterium]|nr:efflux RND transporter periplasmic adaptor subunit [Ignavibacteriales bacterium]HOL80420.1 efflux RND transporter periplasmic adaptor subunit [Ignavibacteriales bacterium]HOM64871.1 efflux RND transporter periplasmic adaptor subunit [Ignavibacteriales bacterium]HPD68086.1 efflux RND transporter periplasmic adaptor subunit [Ignavibacteriales bacterium]HPP32609.1 efflux RND transporter periplasmic adaptor subunit [Ignavibacteriales bacterium]